MVEPSILHPATVLDPSTPMPFDWSYARPPAPAHDESLLVAALELVEATRRMLEELFDAGLTALLVP